MIFLEKIFFNHQSSKKPRGSLYAVFRITQYLIPNLRNSIFKANVDIMILLMQKVRQNIRRVLFWKKGCSPTSISLLSNTILIDSSDFTFDSQLKGR